METMEKVMMITVETRQVSVNWCNLWSATWSQNKGMKGSCCSPSSDDTNISKLAKTVKLVLSTLRGSWIEITANRFHSNVPLDIFQWNHYPPSGVTKVSHCGHVSRRIVQMVAARDRRWVPSAVDVCWLLSSASPPLSSFSCLLTQHTLLFGVTMNHGNWLCCHISNTTAQGLTAWCVTAGRSSLLKGCTAGWPNSASLVQGHTSSYHSKWSRITHVCRKNEDVLFKIPAIVPIRTVFTTAPSVFKLC